jgi:hypothetical protein
MPPLRRIILAPGSANGGDAKGVPRPPMRAFIEPNRDYAMDLSKYDMVYFFGDSMIQQLARRFQTNLYWNDRIFIKKM